MCGIAGFFGRRPIARAVQEGMLSAIGTRGPDARGVSAWDTQWQTCTDRAVSALLHTRLSIRDVREVAGQPMRNEAGDVWVCYNGEVYGWEAAAAELKRQGITFNTSSDTEFILRGYEAWGLGVIDKLRGMFALAILDLRTRTLHLLRDRMGIKPLLYYHADGEFAFASTVRAVLPYVPTEKRKISATAIDAYLAHRYVPAPHTVFQHIARLPAGHRASLDLRTGALSLHRYWQPTPKPHATGLAGAVSDAVALRTVSDRPVGVFLSGGIDSATIASALADQGRRDITAFTAGFPGTRFDEAPMAARIASHLGLPHIVLPISQDIGDDFDDIVAALDEPFADPSSFPSWYLARETAQHVKVVLGGDGGDELFGGYKRYAKHLRHRWRHALQLPLTPIRPRRFPARGARLLDELRMSWLDAYSLRFSGMAPSVRRYLQPDRATCADVYWQTPTDVEPSLAGLLSVDMFNYLPEYILRKADLCTMAHGLELRVPLLDHQLYEHVLSMPTAERFTTPPKQALAKTCRACVGLDLLAQPKRGFNPPVAELLRGSLRPRLVGIGAELESLTAGQLAAGPVEQLVQRALATSGLEEKALQLLILATSLRQLKALAER